MLKTQDLKEPSAEASGTHETQETKKRRKQREKKGFVVARTAFWASLVTALMCVVIAVIVKVLSGILSPQLVFLAASSVIATLLLAIRNRWTALVATLLNAYLFYFIWTEPFVTSSLSNPKGPNGGLGHFYGVVLVICASILAVVCSLGATVQYFRGTSRQTPRWYPVVIGIVIGMYLAGMHLGDVALPYSTTTGLTITNGVATLHVEANGFLQSSITLPKGDKLVLVSDSSEKHRFYNGIWQNGTPIIQQEPGAPLVNGVVMTTNNVTIGPFNTAGTFHIFCTLHTGMELTITVQ